MVWMNHSTDGSSSSQPLSRVVSWFLKLLVFETFEDLHVGPLCLTVASRMCHEGKVDLCAN